jgi:hypothetical protein
MNSAMFTGINFLDVLNQIYVLIPIVLPVIIGFLAFRKGWAFLLGAVKKA